MQIAEITEYRQNGWHGVVSQELAETFQDFSQWFAVQQKEYVVDKSTRQVFRVPSENGVFYVKIVKTLVDGTHFWLDLVKRLKWRLKPSRAIRTMKVMRAMLEKDIRCPEPVLAIRRRKSLLSSPEDVIVTRELNAPLLHHLLQNGEPQEREALLRSAVPDIFAFHHAGFVHGDFLPGNMMWDGSHVAFIDLDRTTPVPPGRLSHARVRELCRFCYRMKDIDEYPRLVHQFLEEYNKLELKHYGEIAVKPASVLQYIADRIAREG